MFFGVTLEQYCQKVLSKGRLPIEGGRGEFIMTTTMPIGTKFGRMVTYYEGLPITSALFRFIFPNTPEIVTFL